jgi:hypothetical protein
MYCTQLNVWIRAPAAVVQMEYGVRQLIPELGCAATLRVVVDTSGVHIGGALRMRGVFQRVGHVLDRMYPCRLHVSILGYVCVYVD